MTGILILLATVAGVIVLAWTKGKQAGADHAALATAEATTKALLTRVEVDHALEQAAAGGASDLAALARSSGLVRPGDK